MRLRDIAIGRSYAVTIRPFGVQKAIATAITAAGLVLVSVPALPLRDSARQVRSSAVACEWSRYGRPSAESDERSLTGAVSAT